MRKKKTFLLLLIAIVCIAAIIVYIASFAGTQANTSKDSQGSSLKPQGEQFVVPENPLGPLGLITALAVAFGVFALKKRP